MKKIEELREQRVRLSVMLHALPSFARDAITILVDVIEEQQKSIDNLTNAVNRLTQKEGDTK